MNIYSVRMLKWPSKEIETFEFKGESLSDIEADVIKIFNQHPLYTQVSWSVREEIKGENINEYSNIRENSDIKT